jgi:hypothetical protein
MRFFYLALIAIIFFSCSNNRTNRVNLVDFIPENTSIIIKSTNIEGLKSSIHNSDFLRKISKKKSYEHLENKFEGLSYLKPSNDILICFSNDSKDSLQYSIITKYTEDLFITDSLPNYIEETLIYKNKTIKKSTINNNTFYSTMVDSTYFASSSKDIADAVFNKVGANNELEKIYSTISNDKTCSILLKANNTFIKSFFIEDSLSTIKFTNYIAVDIDISQNSILINGITKATDSSKSLINIFKNTVPQENQTQSIAPSNSDGFMSFTFDDFKTIETNLAKFNQRDSIVKSSTLFNDTVEVGVIYENENRAIILNSIDVIATKDALLGERTIIDTYREVDVFSFSNPELFTKTFSPLITYNKANIYCVLDHLFVFTDDIDMLQNIITNYQNKTTLSNNNNFQNIKAQLSDASSFLQVSNASTLKSILNKNFNENYTFKLERYNASAIQFIYDTNFAHVNAIIKKSDTGSSLNTVSEELNIKLSNNLLNTPQFVTNHITKQKDIVVQDINNNLYLISNKGKILWKKALNGPVLGTIEQIDIYKNGRLQLAFATPSRVYVLDRNGNNVGPFPVKFNDAITQPLSVFDYDKNKNYRLLVTQGKNVLMYNVKAKFVNGFRFKSANSIIICQPKHFRIGSKDYIVFKSKNKLYLLDRTGKIRVRTKTSNTYSNQPIFLYNNTFTTTSFDGDLISVDTRGNVSSRKLGLSENHAFETTSKTLVALSENKLLIKNKTTELDFGDYSNCQIFYINDQIYVSVTDLQSHKIYLFDSQSKLLSNFPVYGNSSIALDNIDKDRNLEFVTKGDSNSIILYQIN